MTEDVPYTYRASYPQFYWQCTNNCTLSSNLSLVRFSKNALHCVRPDSPKVSRFAKQSDCYSVEFLRMLGMKSSHNSADLYNNYINKNLSKIGLDCNIVRNDEPLQSASSKLERSCNCYSRTRYWSSKKSLPLANCSSESPSPNSYDSDDSGLSSNASSSAQSTDKGGVRLVSSSTLACAMPTAVFHPAVPPPSLPPPPAAMFQRRWMPRPIQNYQRLRHADLYYQQHLNKPHFIAPDRYLMSSNLFVISKPSPDLLNGSKWDSLSQDIWDQFMLAQQTEDTFKRKMMLWRNLYMSIRSMYPRYGLYLVGSTVSGFGSDSSDMDLCLLVSSEVPDDRTYALFHLEAILYFLRSLGPNIISYAELIRANVPILKFRDSHNGIEVDLNCNNEVGIRNTRLLFYYSQMDWRVRPLVLMVKLWARYHNINDAKNKTVSSYSLALMVIHYLQCGCIPAVLSCLEAEPYRTSVMGLVSSRNKPRAIDPRERPPNTDTPLNTQSLGELLCGFLFYYATFEYDKYAVSVRTGSKVPVEICRNARSQKNNPHQWKLLCIEEPFDLTNTARSVYDPEVFERIRGLFKQSHRRLSDTLRLGSIVHCQRR